MGTQERRPTHTYASSGVSVAANEQVVSLIQSALRRTHDSRVISRPNGFVGLLRLNTESRGYTDPVLVSCSDGVGTKLLVAARLERLDTIGIDLVAMNVNDLITCGAAPLFFLDCVSVHHNDPRRTAAIIEGMATGCQMAGCALLGGETAEMPDVYKSGEFDLAGFAVGVVEHEDLITGQAVHPGDAIIGLASAGIHANGYTLVRRLFDGTAPYTYDAQVDALGCTLGEELLRPTRIYVPAVLSLLARGPTVIKGIAHITGGGMPGNIPRVLPADCRASIHKGSWPVPPIFSMMQNLGVAEEEMYRVFNMGIGLALVVRPEDQAPVIRHFKEHDTAAWTIGVVQQGENGLSFENRPAT